MKIFEMHKVENYFEAFLVVFLIILFFILVKPFLFPILLSAAIVFVTYGFYKKTLKRIKSESFVAMLFTMIILILIVVPSSLLLVELVKQGSFVYSTSVNLITPEHLESCKYSFCRTISNNIVLIQDLVKTNIYNFISFGTNSIGTIFTSVSKFVINFFVFVTSLFFFFKDGDKFLRYVYRIVPMKNEYKQALFLRFRDTTSAIFYSYIFVGIIQGVLLGVLLMFLGFKTWIFLAVITAFLSVIPFSGPAIVWFPISIYLLFSGKYVSSIVLFVIGLIVVSFSEDFLRPIFIRNKVKINYFLVFIGILGGIATFGLVGLFLGPLIISLLISVVSLYKLEFD